MNSDILFEMPSYCDDCETWHKSFYWIYQDGTYSVCDEDGDHEDVEEADLPTQDEHDKAWREYAQWVVDTGNDPLGNYLVQHVHKVNERWEFKFWKSLTGPRLSEARRAGRRYEPWELPEHVRSFLRLSPTNNVGDFPTWDDLVAAVPNVKPYTWFVAHLEQDHPRNEETIARELRKAARKALSR